MRRASETAELTPSSETRVDDAVLPLDPNDVDAITDALAELAHTARETKNEAVARFMFVVHDLLVESTVRGSNVMLALAFAGPSSEDVARERLADLTEQMMPQLDLPTEAAVVLARRNVERRTALLQEFGALTGDQIGEEHSRAKNRHALAARWRKAGKVFGVPYRGQRLYPAFQFDDDGRPREVVAKVLSVMPRDRMTEWEVALWWTAGNGWLGGHRPVDVMEDSPDEVLRAAARLGAPSPL